MKIKILTFLITFVCVLTFSAFAAEGPNKTNQKDGIQLSKATGSPIYQILNINNITTWMRADGQQNHSPTSDNGSYYPRGTKWVIYQDGFVWGAKPYLDEGFTTQPTTQPIRVGGQTYNIGTRAGRIIGSGANAVAADPAADDVRIYRIRRDYASMKEAELIRDAADYFEKLPSSVTTSDIEKIIAQYEKDWNEWPVAYGAPYIERNGLPGYQKPKPFSATFTVDSLIAHNYDEPGLAGIDPSSPADQVIWTVFNDLDPSATRGLFGSEPLGLECQLTLWGYKRTDAMGNLYFKKIKFINKGGVDIGGGTKGSFYIDSMFFAQWADPDLGAFGDDLCGVDTTIIGGKSMSLGYVYNGTAVDAEFKKFNLAPPAVGYDFLQGPLVDAPGESGVFNLRRVYDKKNLPLTSFAYFSAGSPISDPPFSYVGALRWWRMLQGFVPEDAATWRLFPHPPGVTPTKFPLAGDPVKKVGFIDGLGTLFSYAPGDRRIVLNTGPFRLLPGEMQEVVVGTVAGLGSDRLSSVSVMKFNDRFVQNTYDDLFSVPKPPPSPNVKIAEMDGYIVLEWGSDLNRTKAIEETVIEPGSYVFEGYNVYQLPSAGALLSTAKRIATFDLLEDPAVILDEQFDPVSGQILQLPVQFGTNSGIQREFKFSRDYILDQDRLNNGQEYFIAVTAYSRTLVGYLPGVLESNPIIYTVRPRSAPPGVRYYTQYGDTILPAHITGIADADFEVKIIDPTRLTGDTYQVRTVAGDSVSIIFGSDTLKFPNYKWQLFNVTKGAITIPANSNFSIDMSNIIVDGFKFGMTASPHWIPGKEISRQEYFPPANFSWSPVNWGGAAFDGGLDVGWNFFGSTIRPFEINQTVEVRFDSTTKQSAYVFTRVTGTAAAPYTGFFPQPFTVWDVTNPASPRQIDFIVLEQVGRATRDSVWGPGTASADREYFAFVDEDYTATEKPEYAGKTYGWIANKPITYTGWYVRSATSVPYRNGDVWRITATKVLTATDRWQFETMTRKSTMSIDLAKKDVVNKINVYPNPYYAFNPSETNRFVRFVTFNNLPPKATLRIFNLAGQLVRTLYKEDPTTFARWDLNNENNFPVASGMYIVHVDMPDLGVSKILKLAIIQEQEIPEVF